MDAKLLEAHAAAALAKTQAKARVDELLERSRQGTEVIVTTVRSEVTRQLESVGSAALVDHGHVDALVDAYREYRAVAHHLSLEAKPAVVPVTQLAATREAVRELWETYLGAGPEPQYRPPPRGLRPAARRSSGPDGV